MKGLLPTVQCAIYVLSWHKNIFDKLLSYPSLSRYSISKITIRAKNLMKQKMWFKLPEQRID